MAWHGKAAHVKLVKYGKQQCMTSNVYDIYEREYHKYINGESITPGTIYMKLSDIISK